MQGLFDPARHEPLTATAWSEDAARAALLRIVASAHNEMSPAGCWPTHPRDDPASPTDLRFNLYWGAGGVVWALRYLSARGAITLKTDHTPPLAEWAQRNRAINAGDTEGTASYLFGDAGLLLLHWQMTRDAALADALHAVVLGNLHHPAQEALWGNPGTVLTAIHMAEATGEPRWATLVQQAVQVLWDQMGIDPYSGAWMWQQYLYGKDVRYLGAGHGFAGNVFPALRGAALLDPALVAGFAGRALQTLQSTALRSAGGANWHPFPDVTRMAGRLPPVQDCHGAPGIICRLATAPRSAEWDELLRAAGELSWFAGPLNKGASLCHGTGGSAMACLKLWRRFDDEEWLHRARLLAMHGIEQCEAHRAEAGQGRHSLWTGDLGLACVLWNCISADDHFPTLDRLQH